MHSTYITIFLWFNLLLLNVFTGFAQTGSFRQSSLINTHFSVSKYHITDNGRNKPAFGIGIDFIKGINAHLDWQFTFNGTYATQINQQLSNEDKKLLLTTTAAIRVRVFNHPSILQPYALAGIGFSKYQNSYGSYVPGGAGLQVLIFKNAYLLLNSQYRFGLTNTINNHFFHSIGLAGTVSKRKSSSINKPKPQLQIAIATTDRDSDNDGIPDINDSCPQTIGVAKYNGCPVPDTDKDGINDEEDKCIDIPGVREYAGCPPPKREVKPDIKAKVDGAAKAIYFETGSAILLPASDSALNQLITILKEDLNLNLSIEGHTDNIGTPASNEELSRNRANAVLNYLIKNGISTTRLTAKGFGQTQPIADNNTENGRATNRRVELKLAY